MWSISCHIMPLVNGSLGGRYTHTHACTRAHTHTHIYKIHYKAIYLHTYTVHTNNHYFIYIHIHTSYHIPVINLYGRSVITEIMLR